MEWLGDVPEHWEATTVGKIAAKVGSGKTPRGGAEVYGDQGVIFIRSQNVHNEGLRLDDVVFIDEEVDEEMAETRVLHGDALLNITGASLGRCSGVFEEIGPANVNQHVCIIRPDRSRVDPAFLWRAFVSAGTQSQIFSYENGSSREGLNFQQVRGLLITRPPLSEQRAIADFLDERTRKLDVLIEKKQDLIEKLQEKRTALISQTVTRGLPPEAAKAAGLNPHPKMKDCGIPWWGEIPEHWELKRSDAIVSSGRTQISPELFKDREVFHYSIPTVQEFGTGAIEDGERIASAKQPINRITLLVSKLNPRKATICIAEKKEQPTVCSTEFVALYAENCYLQYLKYVTLSELFRQRLDSRVQSVTRSHQRAESRDITRFWFTWPSISEQQCIANFLDYKTAQMDALIERLISTIKVFKEYRSALITAAVTGKIDVRSYTRD